MYKDNWKMRKSVSKLHDSMSFWEKVQNVRNRSCAKQEMMEIDFCMKKSTEITLCNMDEINANLW